MAGNPEEWLRRWPVYVVDQETGGLLLPLDMHGEPVDVLMGVLSGGLPVLQVDERTARMSIPVANTASVLWRQAIHEAMCIGGQL